MSRVAVLVAVLLTLVVLGLLLAPPSLFGGGSGPAPDKWIHAAVFAVLGLAWAAAGMRAWALIGFGAVFAIGTEIMQQVSGTGRQGEVLDACADLAGIAIAALAAGLSARLRRTAPAAD